MQASLLLLDGCTVKRVAGEQQRLMVHLRLFADDVGHGGGKLSWEAHFVAQLSGKLLGVAVVAV